MVNAHHPTCPTAVVCCKDHRLHEPLSAAIRAAGLGDHDLLSGAGGAKRLLPWLSRWLLLWDIRHSILAHAISTLVLVMHWDCGANGRSAAFDHNPIRERAALEAMLTRSEAIVRRYLRVTGLPALQIRRAIQYQDHRIEWLA